MSSAGDGGRSRGFALVLLAVVVLFAGLMYVLRSGSGARPPASAETPTVALPESLQALRNQPRIYFRSTRQDAAYGRLIGASLSDLEGTRVPTNLSCERLDVAGGTGVCLTADRGVLTTYSATIFDEETFEGTRTIRLGGIPSRVRVSPDGRLAGITVFVTGHAYSQDAFSTQTTIVDTRTAQTLAELESFAVEKDGKPFKNQDFNFWGVTFTRDSNRFYATLSSRNVYYLIRGDAAARRAEVIGEGVECPSLSPDNRRVAFKQREVVGGRLVWRVGILDLQSGARSVLTAETRSVDDQMEWLDDDRLLYSTPDPERAGSMLVSVASLRDGTVTQLLADAYSPAVP